MKCSSIYIVLLLVCTSVPAALFFGDGTSRSPDRADPVIGQADVHHESATWDFYASWAYCATAVDLAPGKANLSMTTRPGADKWTQLSSMGAGAERDDFSAAYDDVNGQVIVHGGRYLTNGMADTDWFRPLQTYDPALNAWTDRGASMLPAGNVGVWDGPDLAFLTHGGHYTYQDLQGVTVHAVNRSTYAWLPATQAWSQRADGPRLYHHATVYDPIDGLMITMGGMDTQDVGNGSRDYYYNSLYTYDYTTDKWSLRNATGSLPPLRAYHTAVWDDESGRMIIFGGYNGQAALSDCYAYNYSQNLWTQLASAAATRYMHSASWDPQKALMLVSGGRTGLLNSNETLAFDPSANSWSAGVKLPAPARLMAAAAFDPANRETILCGGGDGTGSDQLQEAWAYRQGDPVPEYLPSGSVQSGALDLGPGFHSVDRVSWDGDMPVGTGVSLRFRSSNINVDASGFQQMANGSKPTQQGRHLQWNLTLQASSDHALSPVIRSVRVEYTLNNKPVATATGPIAGYKRNAVQLNGTATDQDGDELTYLWTKLSGPPVTPVSPNSAATTFTPEASGTYVFTLVASDAFADSPGSTVTVTVNNRRPRAEAGPDQSGVKSQLMIIGGRGMDEDRDPLAYEWTQLGGPNVSFAPDRQNLSFTADRLGNYTFRLVVDDGEETSAPAIVNATINGRSPMAELAVEPASTFINETVNFSASGSSDPDGKLVARMFDFGDGNKTAWTSAETADHSYSRPGEFDATVTVRDDDGFASEPSPPVKITVRNRPPVAGASVTPDTGNTSTLFRFLVPKGSTYDPDGAIVSYLWDFGDGTNSSSNTAVHSYREKGAYEVIFRVTDEWGASTEQALEVSVGNRPPGVAASAPAQNITLNTGLEQLFSVDFSDPDNDALAYVWTVNGVRQPDNGNRFFWKPEKPGRYIITATASDGEGLVIHSWEVTAGKRPAAVERTDWTVYGIAALAVILVAGVAGAFVAVRRARPKDEPVVVYAPPGYRPGDILPASSGPGAKAAPSRPPPSSAAHALSPPSTTDRESAPAIATVVATAPSADGQAPMEAIPYAEPVAPSAGSAAMEAEPFTEEGAARPPAATAPAPAPRRPPKTYRPPPRSDITPREPYAEKMWKR